MECTEAHSKLIRYADNDLMPADRARVEEHLEHCYLCQEEYHELVGLLDVCQEVLRHPRPRDLFGELRPHLRMTLAPPRRPYAFLKKLTTGLAIAAGLLMFLSVAEPIVTAARQFMAFKLDTCVDHGPAPQAAENVPFPEFFSWRNRIISWERDFEPNSETMEAGKDTEAPQKDATQDKTNGPVSHRVKKAKRVLA